MALPPGAMWYPPLGSAHFLPLPILLILKPSLPKPQRPLLLSSQFLEQIFQIVLSIYSLLGLPSDL